MILIGTYWVGQFKKWKGYYNYPISDADKIDPQSYAKINELWLFNGTKSQRTFVADFVGVKTRKELVTEYKYPAKGCGHGDKYLLFKVKRRLQPSRKIDRVFIRLKDFAKRSPKIAAQLKQFLESTPEGRDAFLRVRTSAALVKSNLPRLVISLPKDKLIVGEAALQMDFLGAFGETEKLDAPFVAPKNGAFTFIDLFAGIGGIRLGYQAVGGKCVFSSEWDSAAVKTYFANFGERPHGDIQKIDPKDIPDFDVLLAGFPCQPFSIIGDKEGFKHETQGTLFFNIEKILLAKKPKAFMLENVRNLTAHDGGRTFKIILSHLRKAGYDVHYKVLNALDYGVPQKRERIIICGFRNPVDFKFPAPIPKESRKTIADIIDKDADKDRTLFVRAAIRESRLRRLRDKNFPKPYISHENVAGSITPHPYSCALRAGASANYILINDERRPSAREMLRIQGFPDAFKIVVPYSQIKHQTGNSVAVPVISAVARELVSHLKECEE